MKKCGNSRIFSAVVRSCFRSSPSCQSGSMPRRCGRQEWKVRRRADGRAFRSSGWCLQRTACRSFDLHISDSGRIPLKEQAGIVLKTSHNPVLSLAETLPGNAADLCGQGILFGFAQGNGGFRIDKWHGNILLYI